MMGSSRFPILFVTPAKAGVHGNVVLSLWIPAFAGMTMK